MQKLSERRLKENEVVFQQANQGVADFVIEDRHDADAVIKFYCECSNIDCRERIILTAGEYHKLHNTERLFIALNGHEIPAIERIVANHGSFNQIEKEGEVPSVVDIDKILPASADSTEG